MELLSRDLRVLWSYQARLELFGRLKDCKLDQHQGVQVQDQQGTLVLSHWHREEMLLILQHQLLQPIEALRLPNDNIMKSAIDLPHPWGV